MNNLWPRKGISFVIVLLMIAFLFGIITPAFSLEKNEAQNPTFVELIIQLIQQIAMDIRNNMPNLEEFLQEVKHFNTKMQMQFPSILNQWTTFIQQYAQNSGNLQGSSQQLFADLGSFTNSLWDQIMQFPQLKTVQNIIQPTIDKFVHNFLKKLPKIRRDDPNNNPLAIFSNFYNDMAQTNPHELGPLFKNEPLPKGEEQGIIKEKIQEETHQGVRSTNILFREIIRYSNQILAFHQLIINNTLVKLFQKREDLTVYHGMPQQMRQEGINKNVVRWVEEYINLMNFNLVKAHYNNGLIIDIHHPQLKYPHGYNAQTFIKNFTQLLKNWQNSLCYTFKRWEQKLKITIAQNFEELWGGERTSFR